MIPQYFAHIPAIIEFFEEIRLAEENPMRERPKVPNIPSLKLSEIQTEILEHVIQNFSNRSGATGSDMQSKITPFIASRLNFWFTWTNSTFPLGGRKAPGRARVGRSKEIDEKFRAEFLQTITV